MNDKKYKTIETDIQPRFADFDILGHVNNVNLQHYFDVGKHDYFSSIMETDSYWQNRKGIITAATNTSYLAQVRPNEQIYVETTVEKIGNKSITLYQRLISRHNAEVKAESRSVMVAFDFNSQTSIIIPRAWHESAVDN